MALLSLGLYKFQPSVLSILIYERILPNFGIRPRSSILLSENNVTEYITVCNEDNTLFRS